MIGETMQPTITMIERPEPHMREAIVRPLIVFNNSRASQPEDYRPLVIILSDPDTGEILGGLWGETRGFRLQRRPMSAMPPLGLSVELAALMAL